VTLPFRAGRPRADGVAARARRGRHLYVGVARHQVDLRRAPDGSVRWSYPIPPGAGRFRNNQAVIGADGTVVRRRQEQGVRLRRTATAAETASCCGLRRGEQRLQSSPIIGAPGRLYVGSGDPLAPVLYAIGDCP
jgi:hypothetical protein